VRETAQQHVELAGAPSRPDGHGGAHTVGAACRRLGNIGRSTLYGLIADGRLEAVKLGRRTLITDASIASFIAGLPRLTKRAVSSGKGSAR
jgi:excisionase family DNA binding protein